MKIRSLRCFQHVNWQPDRRELRRFAASMLGGFLLLGLLAVMRSRQVGWAPQVLWSLALVLAMGALVPGLGRVLYLGVYLPTALVGFVVSNVLLTLLFLALFTPLGLALRLLHRDPLRLKWRNGEELWVKRDSTQSSKSYLRQY
jgi:hypothetical protein